MPLLRRKPFVPEKPSPSLKPTDEVFYCELTGEIFLHYEAFYQRVILCNSVVWSCECTGKPNLTFKEAKESEENVKKSLAAFPEPLKRAVLALVHHTRRSKIQDLTDEIYDFLKNRYQVNEDVEVKVKEKWILATIVNVPEKINMNLLKSPQKNHSPLKSPNKENDTQQTKIKTPLGNKNQWPDGRLSEYKVKLDNKKLKLGEYLTVKGKTIRRLKGVFIKDKVKLYIRQTCIRTTTTSDDGYWVVLPNAIQTFSLGISSVVKKSPTKKAEGKSKKGKDKNKKNKHGKVKEKVQKGKSKPMTLEEKRKQYLLEKEKEKQQKLLDLETAKIKKLKEKEEEKARKRDEREKEREMVNELKKLEIEFFKEFSKVKEDLRLEDSKPLPSLVPLKATLTQELIGDAIMVVEFVNLFGGLFDISEEIESKITLDWVEEALTEHDAEGKYYQILRFLLHAYLKFEQDEKDHQNDEVESSSSGEEDGNVNKLTNQVRNGEDENSGNPKKPSKNAKAAAAWPMLTQGLALHEITIEPFSLTEVLRLHILSSGVRFGSITNWYEWQHRGQFQLSDDPCLSFRHKECDIMQKIKVGSVYDLSSTEKLKILVMMCDQMLMLGTCRDFMEDSRDKAKELRKKLREMQNEENARRRNVQKEKWKKKVAERTKQKEVMEKSKQEKKALADAEKSQKSENNKDSPSVSSVKGNENDDKSEETLEQLEDKKKRKEAKEAKENQVEEFYRDKFLFNERQLLEKIAKHNAVISEVPLGQDRIFRRYWKFFSVDGVFVENDDNGAELLMDLNRHEKEDADFESEDEAMEDCENRSSKKANSVQVPKVPLEEILKARENGQDIEKLLLNRYKCEFTTNTPELLSRSSLLKSCFDNVNVGIDPGVYASKDRNKWYNITSKEQFLAVLDSLNSRGIREQALQNNCNNKKYQIVDYYLECEKETEKNERNLTKRQKATKKVVPNQIDKTLFKCMEDYVEGSLRDQLLELEERIYFASFGNSRISDRDAWRSAVEEGMTKLISAKNAEENSTKESFVNGDTNHINGNITTKDEPMETEPVIPSALPHHLRPGNVKNEDESSRCSTPVMDDPESEKVAYVRELSHALLELEKALENKYIKPPLGETQETKKERLKDADASGKVNGDSKDEEKKASTSLSRWEESLISCTSFSQVFVHLSTLDRSIMWDKSIQNVKCRVCRRKGNDDEMLLCDGCDRGFHMSCLTPRLKNVPVGDWFCKDCKPVDVRRRNVRKHSNYEETEEEETEEETEEEDEDDEEKSGEEEEESEEEDEDDEEEEEGSDGSEHEERCTVCDGDGTLLLCDNCPRGYHTECCFPPLKKVPRGSWSCQICKGTDSKLPPRKRAATIEKKREKSAQGNTSTKQQRGQPGGVKRTEKSPVDARPSKRARINQSESKESPRVSVGRQQLKSCMTLLNEIAKREEAELFMTPVDSKEVPDYLDFVDNPMDFGTIKRKLNGVEYMSVNDVLSDIYLVFTNCETYNPPRSQVARDGNKLKTFIKKKIKELKLE